MTEQEPGKYVQGSRGPLGQAYEFVRVRIQIVRAWVRERM